MLLQIKTAPHPPSTDSNGVVFKLNSKDLTAAVTKSKNAKGDILIPRSIMYEKSEYTIIQLEEDSFFNNDDIRSVSFAEDSQIRSFGTNVFTFSNIQSLQFPKYLEKLELNWYISPENSRYTYLDPDHKVILSKSDQNSPVFDVLVFACRDITKVAIPSYIKHISSSAFNGCKKLIDFQIDPNSQLETVGEDCFEYTIFTKIKLPSTLQSIEDGFFSQGKIEICEFDENCPLDYIPNSAFISSKLKSLSIPKNVFQIHPRSLFNTKITTIILSPQNPYFCYIDDDHKIIAGKTKKNSAEFDILYFACKDIRIAYIPSSIKYIMENAFYQCHKLETLQFDDNCSIKTLGSYCFSECRKLKKVKLPSGLKKTGYSCFSGCISLESFEFLDKLIYIDPGFFTNCPNLNTIDCPNAEKIVYDDNSFDSVGPNFKINHPPNAVVSKEDNNENKHFKYSFRQSSDDDDSF